jgi:hypothetical protein
MVEVVQIQPHSRYGAQTATEAIRGAEPLRFGLLYAVEGLRGAFSIQSPLAMDHIYYIWHSYNAPGISKQQKPLQDLPDILQTHILGRVWIL